MRHTHNTILIVTFQLDCHSQGKYLLVLALLVVRARTQSRERVSAQGRHTTCRSTNFIYCVPMIYRKKRKSTSKVWCLRCQTNHKVGSDDTGLYFFHALLALYPRHPSPAAVGSFRFGDGVGYYISRESVPGVLGLVLSLHVNVHVVSTDHLRAPDVTSC